VQPLEYTLLDSPLLSPDGTPGRCLVWTPPNTAVVIGKGSKIEEEINIEICEQDRVAIIRRGTGGCAVVISPDMLVVTFALYTDKQQQSKEYFLLFNKLIITALEQQSISSLSHQGISDITLGDKKIAGTALYRKRDLVFYHAILNVSDTTDLMERYLKTPPRTPDYRQNRSHSDFVTSLREQGYSLDKTTFAQTIEREFDLTLI
jgi:lipoate-protein ligase A